MAISPEGTVLWAGSDSGMVLEFSCDGLQKRRFLAHKGGVTCLAVTKGRLATGGRDGLVRCWCPETLAMLFQQAAPGNRVRTLRIDCARQTIRALTTNGQAKSWCWDGSPANTCERFEAQDIQAEPGTVLVGGLCLRAVGARIEAWARQGKAWEAVLPGFDRATAIAASEEDVWIAGRGARRAGLLARFSLGQRERADTWELPYTAACLAFWRDDRTLYAGGRGRIFAIELPRAERICPRSPE